MILPMLCAHRLHPRLRVGDVRHALIGPSLGRLGGAGRFGGARLVKLGLGLAHSAVPLDRHRPATTPVPRRELGFIGGDRLGQPRLGQCHFHLDRSPTGQLVPGSDPGQIRGHHGLARGSLGGDLGFDTLLG